MQQRQHPRLADMPISRPKKACPQCLGAWGEHWCGYRQQARPQQPVLAIQDAACPSPNENPQGPATRDQPVANAVPERDTARSGDQAGTTEQSQAQTDRPDDQGHHPAEMPMEEEGQEPPNDPAAEEDIFGYGFGIDE